MADPHAHEPPALSAPSLPIAGLPFHYSEIPVRGSQPLEGGAAFVGGRFVPAADAKISLFDEGFLHSNTTYTVFHVWNGMAFRVDEHLERLFSGAHAMLLDPPYTLEETKRLALELVAASALREAYVSVTLTNGYPDRLGGDRETHINRPQLYMYAIPYSWIWPPERVLTGVHGGVMHTARRAGRNVIDPQIKNYGWGDLNRAIVESTRREIEAPILLDGDGMLAEGPGYNVFVVKDGALATASRNALPGITRRTVVELAGRAGLPVAERDVTPAELYEADEMFATTTAGGLTPIVSLDGADLGDGTPGPITRTLLTAYWEAVVDPESPWTTAIAY